MITESKILLKSNHCDYVEQHKGVLYCKWMDSNDSAHDCKVEVRPYTETRVGAHQRKIILEWLSENRPELLDEAIFRTGLKDYDELERTFETIKYCIKELEGTI